MTIDPSNAPGVTSPAIHAVNVPKDGEADKSESDYKANKGLDLALEIAPDDEADSEDIDAEAQAVAREAALNKTLWNMQDVFKQCSGLDPTWKVPEVEIRGLRRGGIFSY